MTRPQASATNTLRSGTGPGLLENTAARRRLAWRHNLGGHKLGGHKLVLACIGLMTIAAAGLTPVAAVAATATGTFAVTASVQASCVVSATPLAFGTYIGTVLNSTATLTITCTNTTPYNILLNPGTATGATVSTRMMTFGTFTLAYALSANAGQTTNWGQTIGTDTVVGTGNGTAQTVTVYGQVAAGQFVNPGAYADTITATISY